MDVERLRDEYDKHHTIEGLEGVDFEGHLAALVAVARLQAEHDAQIADAAEAEVNGRGDFSEGEQSGIARVADAIRAQFS